jgi:hypothetical protein
MYVLPRRLQGVVFQMALIYIKMCSSLITLVKSVLLQCVCICVRVCVAGGASDIDTGIHVMSVSKRCKIRTFVES